MRALTGASAFTIAALASPRFRGGAAIVAAVLIAAFVLANLALLYASARPEALDRLSDAEDRIATRRAKLSGPLSEELTSRVSTWKAGVTSRIDAGAAILVVPTLALLTAGLVAGLTTTYECAPPATTAPAK